MTYPNKQRVFVASARSDHRVLTPSLINFDTVDIFEMACSGWEDRNVIFPSPCFHLLFCIALVAYQISQIINIDMPNIIVTVNVVYFT